MAPSPEHDNEPKAPDKNEGKTSDAVEIRANSDFLDEALNTTSRDLNAQESSVSTLDDGQLKALLDEAINYKTPKDREGKSSMFKALLQEAEEDERNARAASASGPQLARYYTTTPLNRRNKNRKETTASSTLTHGGSLQDLAKSDLYTDGQSQSHSSGKRAANRRRHQNAPQHGHHPVTGHRTVSVSARQREGGSLPSNVNAGARNLFDDYEAKKGAKEPNTCVTPITTSSVGNTTASAATSTTEVSESTTCSPPNYNIPKVIEVMHPLSTSSRPEYTIVELGGLQNEECCSESGNPSSNSGSGPAAAAPEETRSLLNREARSPNYSAIETSASSNSSASMANSSDVILPQYRYPHGDLLECTSPPAETPSGGETITSTFQKNFSFDNMTRHQYFNPLEEIATHHHRSTRTKKFPIEEIDLNVCLASLESNPAVDKTISFSQLQPNDCEVSNSLQLNPDYNSVRCIVDGSNATAFSVDHSVPGANSTSSSSSSSNNSSNLPRHSGGSLQMSKIPSEYRLFSTKPLETKKGLDENGNSVVPATNNSTSLLDAKKKKKNKVDKKVKMIKAEQVEGHRGDLDLDVLVKYIEANGSNSSNSAAVNSGLSNKGTGSQHAHNKMLNNTSNNSINHLNSNSATKREIVNNNSSAPSLDSSKKAKRVKTKSETGGSKTALKKCNSLEEISKTKLDDLVAHKMSKNSHNRYMKKQSTSEDGDGLEKESTHMMEKSVSANTTTLGAAAPHKDQRERRSWGSEDSAQFLRSSGVPTGAASSASSSQLPYEFDAATAINVLTAETAEFHVVTKKKKSKKRNSTPANRQQFFDEFHGKNVNSHGPSYHYHRIEQTPNAHHGEKTRGGHMHHTTTTTSSSSNSSSSTGGGGGGRSANSHSTALLSTRRKSSCSVPHSDKSGDSSDSDSVHSLPAGSTTHRISSSPHHTTEIPDSNSIEGEQASGAAVSPSSTSYADIAKNASIGLVPGATCGVSPPNTLLVPVAVVVVTQTNQVAIATPANNNNNNNNWKANALRSDQFPELGAEPAGTSIPQQRNTSPPVTTSTTTNAASPPMVQATNTQTYQQQRDAFPSLKAVNGPVVPQAHKKLVSNKEAVVVAAKTPKLEAAAEEMSVTVMEPPPVFVNNCVVTKARASSRAPARPAVIILNEAPPPDLHLNNSEPIQVSGLTFGFEVNEQLLNNCNSSGDEALMVEEDEVFEVEDASTLTVPAKTAGELFIAKFVAPPVPDVKDLYNHDRIVTFVGLAWNDVIHQKNGKVTYYSGQ